jgi:hypothetical protein
MKQEQRIWIVAGVFQNCYPYSRAKFEWSSIRVVVITMFAPSALLEGSSSSTASWSSFNR